MPDNKMAGIIKGIASDKVKERYDQAVSDTLTEWHKPTREFMRQEAILQQDRRLGVVGAWKLGKLALENATEVLMPPLELMELIRHRLDAQQSGDEVERDLVESAQASLVLGTSALSQIDMDMDLRKWMGIGKDITVSSEMRRAHNILYTHFSRRRLDPNGMNADLLDAASSVGLQDEKGLNATGALLSTMMMADRSRDPILTSSMMAQGLKELSNPKTSLQVRNATGVDIRKYAPKGKFYGKGGVDGLFDYAGALAGKGITTAKDLARIGITNPGQVALMESLLGNTDIVRNRMENAYIWAGSNKIAEVFSQLRNSDEGKSQAFDYWIDSFRAGRGNQAFIEMQEYQAGLKKRHPELSEMYSKVTGKMSYWQSREVDALAIVASRVTPEDQEKSGQRQISTRFGINAQADMQKLPAINITDTDRKNSTRRQTVGRFGMDLTTSPHDKVRIPNPESVQHAARKFDPALQRQAAGRFGLGETPRSPRLDRAANSAQKAGSTMQNININVNLHGLADKIFSIVTEANTRNARRQ